MARIHTATAKKAGKTCGRIGCGKAIEKGEQFYWSMPGFRSSWKSRKIRCMAHPFRPSELTTSLRGDAYAAIEAAEDDLNGLGSDLSDDANEIQAIIDTAAEAIREVESAYEEAAEPFGGGGPNGEAKEEMGSAADDLEALQLGEYEEDDDEDQCEEHNEFDPECDDCKDVRAEHRAAWAQEQIDNALGALGDLSI